MLKLSCLDVDDDEDLIFFHFPNNCSLYVGMFEKDKMYLLNFWSEFLLQEIVTDKMVNVLILNMSEVWTLGKYYFVSRMM